MVVVCVCAGAGSGVWVCLFLETNFASIIFSNDFRFAVLMSDKSPLNRAQNVYVYRTLGLELSWFDAHLSPRFHILAIANDKVCNLSNCCFAISIHQPSASIDSATIFKNENQLLFSRCMRYNSDRVWPNFVKVVRNFYIFSSIIFGYAIILLAFNLRQ